jgi:hypothetical protein
VRVVRRSANRLTQGVAQVAGHGGGAGRGDKRKRGAKRRGARGSLFPRWKDRLPGCDAGRRTWARRGARGAVSPPSEGLPSGGLWMRAWRERGTWGGARPRSTVGHPLDRMRGFAEGGVRPRFTVGYRLLARGAGRGGLSPGRDWEKSAPAAL